MKLFSSELLIVRDWLDSALD